MAINKVVNKSTKSHGAMRNVLEYVLRDEKVKEGYVEIAGPYSGETINYDEVYQTWLAEKRLWDKDSGRMYTHNIISFHKDEKVTPEQVLEIGREFAEKFFSGHQYVIGVHQDKDHLHCHIVTNSVSYLDGMKLHQTKRDLEHQKEFTNNLCLERGLTIAEKGHHFDGSVIEQGEITAWSKDKYNLLLNDTKKSFVAECAIAIMEVVPQSASREEFISSMEERGWSVQWEDSRKHIVFKNEDGKKVRDTNIEKTFAGMEVNKEALLNEFTRQNKLRLARLKADRDRECAEAELKQYYAELESAAAGLDTAKAVRDDTAVTVGAELHNDGSGYSEEERKTSGCGENTDSLIREVEADINDSRSQSRAVVRTENQSVADNKQSVTREAERRLEEQRRALEQERAEAARRKMSHSHGWDR
ncbi:MAG: relaxase/mobilization nuclease domain-containing protein [Lachnospiraceae bacterium]|nr:relaxase/mobilization nuclease domain-containing protein [Lachnospiraceae bacterium]